MTCDELIKYIKNYEEQIKNYQLYMEKITRSLAYNPIYAVNIKRQIPFDDRLKRRIIELASTSYGSGLKDIFPNLFDDDKIKKR